MKHFSPSHICFSLLLLSSPSCLTCTWAKCLHKPIWFRFACNTVDRLQLGSKNYKSLHSTLRSAQRLFSQPEQAELRGAVARVGFAAALVSRRVQHHSPDCGKPRWAPFMEWNGILFSGSAMYMAFGVKAGKVS